MKHAKENFTIILRAIHRPSAFIKYSFS